MVTDRALLEIKDGKFIIKEVAPGFTAEDIKEITAGPVEISDHVKTMEF